MLCLWVAGWITWCMVWCVDWFPSTPVWSLLQDWSPADGSPDPSSPTLLMSVHL